MFCMAAPDAPLPRLSKRAVSSSRSGLPETLICMSSRPDSAPADRKPFSSAAAS